MESPSNFEHFQRKKKIFIANVFPKLATVQGLVTPLTIQRLLETSFDSQNVKRFQKQVKPSWGHFYHIFQSLWAEIIWKTSSWLKFGIKRVVCYHMDCRLQVSCSGLWEFVVPYSNLVLLKTKNIFWAFYSIYRISIKFQTFLKKRKSS